MLSDYAQFGVLMWQDTDFDPSIQDKSYAAELLALNSLMQIWLSRDIRIRVPARQIDDARRRLDPAFREERLRQIVEFNQALRCINLDNAIEEAGIEALFETQARPTTNDEWDLSLLMEAIESGCHVFLTRDRALLKKRPTFEQWWISVVSPSQLLGILLTCGEGPIGMTGAGVMPDTHKWQHVMNAHSG